MQYRRNFAIINENEEEFTFEFEILTHYINEGAKEEWEQLEKFTKTYPLYKKDWVLSTVYTFKQ